MSFVVSALTFFRSERPATAAQSERWKIEPFGVAGGAAWELSARGTTRSEGFVADGVQASWLHVHWAAHPELAQSFAAAAARPIAA